MDRRAQRGRRLVQLYTALLYNAYLRGFVKGEIFQDISKGLCVPGLNCYSCPGAVASCPLGTLQNALANLHRPAGWYIIGILALFGLTLGRTVCGWLCPFGLVQELLHKIPGPKIRKSAVTRALSRLKYVILALFVLALPVYYGLSRGVALPAFCKYICPAGTLEGAVALLIHPQNGGLRAMLGALFARKAVILAAVIAACACCYRAFCRFLCPLGAIYGLFHRVALTGVRLDEGACTHCGACLRACPMDIKRVGDGECIACGKCMSACHFGALSFRVGPLRVGGSRRAAIVKRAAAAAALVLLIVLLVWANGPATNTSSAMAPAADEGFEVGQRLADFTVECLDGTEFSLSAHRGQVVLINLWATYCAPCLEEMPLFIALENEYPEDVAVLAVHPSLAVEDVSAFVTARGWPLQAAWDENDEIWPLVGGSSLLPQTIVVDRDGVVVYNAPGSVTDELLHALLEGMI